MNRSRIARITRIVFRVIRGLLMFVSPAAGACLQVAPDAALHIAPEVEVSLAKAGLHREDLYRVMQIVARYETNGCWGGATGNFDGQWLSAGVMQWNLGTGSLQPLLKRYVTKYSSEAALAKERDRVMPQFGAFFDGSCRSVPLGSKCKALLQEEGSNSQFLSELERLFESDCMRQIQLDYFARAMTTVFDDIARVFGARQPKAWQVAWAMDLKTQQGRFPTDTAMKQIRQSLGNLQPPARKEQLLGILEWYDGLCKSGYSNGVRDDCSYNMSAWTELIRDGFLTPDREETLHFTHLLSRTATNKDGLYQADTFQRRATIVFGKGSVHGNRIAFAE